MCIVDAHIVKAIIFFGIILIFRSFFLEVGGGQDFRIGYIRTIGQFPVSYCTAGSARERKVEPCDGLRQKKHPTPRRHL